MRLWLAWMCYCLGDTYRTGGVLLTNFSEIVHTSSEDKTKAKKIKKKNPIWGFCFFILLTLNFVSMLCCFFLAYSSLPPFLDWIIWVFVVAYCLSCLFIWLWKQWYYFYWAFSCATVASFTTRFFRVIFSHQFLFLLHLSLYIKSILFCWELKNFQIVLMFCDMKQMENSSVLICSAGYFNRCFTSVTECHRYRMKCVQRLTVKLKFPIKDKVTY